MSGSSAGESEDLLSPQQLGQQHLRLGPHSGLAVRGGKQCLPARALALHRPLHQGGRLKGCRV